MIWLGVEMSTSNNTQPPQPPGPDVLFERKQTAEKTLGPNYDAKIGPLKARIREVARESNLSLELAYCQIEVGAKAQERIALSAALFDCLNDSAQAGYEARQEEAKTGDKPKKAPKPPPPPSWPKLLGRGRIIRSHKQVVDYPELPAFLRQHQPLYGAMKPRVEGIGEIGCPRICEFTNLDEHIHGGWLVFAWVVQTRKVNPGTLNAETSNRLREAKAKAEAAGEKFGRAERSQIKEDCKSELFARTLPNTTIQPVAWNLESGVFLFHGSEESWESVARVFNIQGRDTILDKCANDELVEMGSVVEFTDLRKTEVVATWCSKVKTDLRPAQAAHSDFLLWLLMVGVGEVPKGNACQQLGWVLDDLRLATDRHELRLDSADTGALMAALAEGAHLLSCELRIVKTTRVDEAEVTQDYWVHFEAKKETLAVKVSRLPVGGQGEVGGMVVERVLSFERLWAILCDIYGDFVQCRLDSWESVVEAGRKWVGLQLMKRFVFDEASGQGWLFKPQALLPTSEKPSSKRGKK